MRLDERLGRQSVYSRLAGYEDLNLLLPSRAVVRFYNKRGTAEQWIKEGKQAAHWTRLSCHRFRGNEVRRLFGAMLQRIWVLPVPTG